VRPGELAESIIDGFAIRDPKDIDVEAISVDAGMQVRFRKLDGCSATLLGIGDRAIATISPSGNTGRDRFSIGHEFGHWSMHRGQSFYCRAEDFGNYTKADKLKEKQADEFSSHLLMPTSLLRPKIGKLRLLSLSDLRALATDFFTSDAAMAFRVTLLDNFPAVLCCYSAERREWFLLAPMVPSRWRLKQKLDEDTFAYDFVRGARTSGSGNNLRRLGSITRTRTGTKSEKNAFPIGPGKFWYSCVYRMKCWTLRRIGTIGHTVSQVIARRFRCAAAGPHAQLALQGFAGSWAIPADGWSVSA
jgi:hypothetical protein